jgi:hypothetical protein
MRIKIKAIRSELERTGYKIGDLAEVLAICRGGFNYPIGALIANKRQDREHNYHNLSAYQQSEDWEVVDADVDKWKSTVLIYQSEWIVDKKECRNCL